MRHRDRQPRDGLLIWAIRQHGAHQLLRGLGEGLGCGDRRVERDRARSRVEVGEANADRHASAGPGRDLARSRVPMRSARCSRAGRKTRSSPGLPADRRLRSRRSRPAVGLNFPWIAIARQRREFFSRRGTEQPLERPSRSVGQFPNRQHADFGQPRPGDRPHAPHQLDGQVVEEFQLGAGSTTTSPSGLATWEAILARLRARGGFWREAALLPIAQACRADGKADAEFLLRQSRSWRGLPSRRSLQGRRPHGLRDRPRHEG